MKNKNILLARELGASLLKRKWRVTAAESCTGGGLCHALTAVPGSSEWFDLGLVTYSNEAKKRLLKVSAETLAEHGAVSEAVAKQMLVSALACSGADVGVAITGLAGPGGGSAEKPVGTVCFAWGQAHDIRLATQVFSGKRDKVRQKSIKSALQYVLEIVV